MGAIIKTQKQNKLKSFNTPIKKPEEPEPAVSEKKFKNKRSSNYNPVGYIKELDFSRKKINSPSSKFSFIQLSTERAEKNEKKDNFYKFFNSSRKEYMNSSKKMNALEKDFFQMKKKATDTYIKDLDNAKSLDNQNYDYFNKNSYRYLDYFVKMRRNTDLMKAKTQEDTENSNPYGLLANQKKPLVRFSKSKNITNAFELMGNSKMINKHINSEENTIISNKSFKFPIVKAFNHGKIKEIAKDGQHNMKKKEGYLYTNLNKNERIIRKRIVQII